MFLLPIHLNPRIKMSLTYKEESSKNVKYNENVKNKVTELYLFDDFYRWDMKLVHT